MHGIQDMRWRVIWIRGGAGRNITEHMDIKCMFVWDKVRQGMVEVERIGMKEMVTDAVRKIRLDLICEAYQEDGGLMKGSVWNWESSARSE
jgi:hypothetical protein